MGGVKLEVLTFDFRPNYRYPLISAIFLDFYFSGIREQGSGIRYHEHGTGYSDQESGNRDMGTGIRDPGAGNCEL